MKHFRKSRIHIYVTVSNVLHTLPNSRMHYTMYSIHIVYILYENGSYRMEFVALPPPKIEVASRLC